MKAIKTSVTRSQRRSILRKLYPVFALLVLVLPTAAQTKLNGAGATFPYPIYSK